MEWAWLIPTFSFAAFPIIVLFGRFLPGRGSFVAILAIAAGFGVFWFILADFFYAGSLGCGLEPSDLDCSIEWFSVGSISPDWGMIIDPIAIIMLGLVTSVALLVQVYSLGYMKGDPRFGWYFAANALFVASMLTLVLADNFLLLYVSWELVGLGSYLLIGFWHERRSAVEAAKKAFITTRLGDVGLLLGILLLHHETGTFNMSAIFIEAELLIAKEPSMLSTGMATVAALLIFLGAMGKSAQFPFHVWLPDAMEGPTPVSALIHAATMVAAGVYLVARSFPVFEAGPDSLMVVTGIGLITTLMASAIALVATDLKRILAYSTISHLGLMMLSLGCFGVAAAMFHLLTHGFSKALLFLGAGSVMHGAGRTDIRDMGGLRKVMPFTALVFAIGTISLSGIAPFAGFWSKDEILLAVLDHRKELLAFTLLAVFLSALYMVRAMLVTFFGELKRENEQAHEAPVTMVVPMGILALLAGGFGFIALPWSVDFAGLSYFLKNRFLEGESFRYNLWLTSGSIIIALTSFVIGFLVYLWRRMDLQRWETRFSPLLTVVRNKYYIDEVYQLAIDRGVLEFSRMVALFDRIVVNDIAVNMPANMVRGIGKFLRYHVSGRVNNYTMVMAIGALVMGLFWWVLAS
jgi:NADH-quinone oxidoreductase subunit L